MRKRWHKPESARRYRFFAKLLTFAAALLIATAVVDMRIRPVVEEVVSHQAQSAAFRIINAAMLQTLESEAITYDDLVHLTRAADGSVRSIETDIVAINRLKSQMSSHAVQMLQLPEQQTLFIPLGTLLGSNLISGRGPMVEVQILPVGYLQSQLSNNFSSAGINQTLHQVMLETSIQLAAVLPGYTVRTETTSRFCIAETVIVGAIPEGYTIVGEDSRSMLSKINDYKVQ